MPRMVCTAQHAVELADGRPLGPGGTVDLTAEDLADTHNKALIDAGALTKITQGPQDQQVSAGEEPTADKNATATGGMI